jgi:hypothetical protein
VREHLLGAGSFQQDGRDRGSLQVPADGNDAVFDQEDRRGRSQLCGYRLAEFVGKDLITPEIPSLRIESV